MIYNSLVQATSRQAALASLRAIQSVVAGGANTSEFKKYYLEAKVKVDALPMIPENAAIRNVTAIYADATSLFIASQVHQMSADEARYFREKYSNDSSFPFDSVFKDVPRDGFGFQTTRMTTDLASIGAKSAGSMLLILAAKRLQTIQ